MGAASKLVAIRLAPVVFVIVATVAYVIHVQGLQRYALLNAVPILLVLLLAGITLYRGHGAWQGSGWSWPLGTLGYAIPAVGLSLYLHFGYSVDRDGMASEAIDPLALFRFLPIYTTVAGAIGFLIGWIVGRNI